MKYFLFIAFGLIIPFIGLGQSGPTMCPSQVASNAAAFLLRIKTNVVAEIRSHESGDIDEKDLRAMLAALDAASNSVIQAKLQEKLNSAAAQLEAACTQAAAALNDPENKIALSFEPEKWLHEIRLQKTQENILLSNIARFRITMGELLRWRDALKSTAPSSQLSVKLKTRINQLLAEWERSAPIEFSDGGSNQPTLNSEPPVPNKRPTQEPVHKIKELSSASREVLRLAKSGASEESILRFIENSNKRFLADGDAIIYLHRTGLSTLLINAMLGRDAALRKRETASQ